jgi:EAL domain-containing protein (putative c-di-GMP-specific phosphodiesterase class I)
MAGAEVLLRWHHPEVGNISPDRFIPVAEETGLIHSIGRWVLEQSCQRLQQWLQENRLFQGHLSVNVCPSQFSRFDFVDQVQDLLDTYQIDPKTLVLELTETALLHDLQDTIRKLNLCRQKGIKIALDDFGIGYSSLAHLKNLPVDILKIDKAFVQELDQPNEKHYLVQSIIAISQFMELEVIAEGVETLDQRDLLIQFGCETLQGYLFSCPLPEEKFLEWMENYVPKAA